MRPSVRVLASLEASETGVTGYLANDLELEESARTVCRRVHSTEGDRCKGTKGKIGEEGRVKSTQK